MANIPGISGYIQPGAFSRDRVITRGVSIPGGVRVVAVMGEGLREETVVASALGGGADGNAACSPTGTGDGRFFSLANAPVVSGRTELRLNGTLLFGFEGEIDGAGFDSKFDFRLDPATGCVELQGASIGDQAGKGWSASSTNVGNGVVIEDANCGSINTLSVLDSSAPAERWTVRCVGVVRDSNGDPIPGKATFSITGSVSGQVRDSGGNPILFHSSYFTSAAGAVSGNQDPCVDGYPLITSSTWVSPNGDALAKVGDSTPLTTDVFEIDGDLLSNGQVLVGDTLCIDGYVGVEISDLQYDVGTNKTTITLATDSVTVGSYTNWDIRATNVLIDDPALLDANSLPTDSAGKFKSSDAGKVLLICPAGSFDGGLYTIDAVTSARTVRVSSYANSSVAFPEQIGTGGLAETGLTFHMLETNGVLLMGISEGTVPFEVGDRFFVDVRSKSLARGDTLTANYIYQLDLNDPEYFTEANDLFNKHGTPSESNTLSLAAQMAFENGAPGVLAVQCAPAVPRRTIETIVPKVNSLGVGGFVGSSAGLDDLLITIPRPTLGLRNGRPASDSRVNIFVLRGSSEFQIFPNKYSFYDSQLQTTTQLNNWISDPDNAFSYTVVNTPADVVGSGFAGSVGRDSNGSVYFETAEFDFNAVDVGKRISISSMENTSGTLYATPAAIGNQLYTAPADHVYLTVTNIVNDNKVYVSPDAGSTFDNPLNFVDIQFIITDPATVSDDAALLLHQDLVTSGVLQQGDGIKVSYVDENDSTFYDTNWFNALEAMEAFESQIVVPVPTQNITGIFRSVVNHCENMSTIANRKERVAFIGAQKGLTTAALLGTQQLALEDVGVLEGIQGDDPAEVLSGNIEDLTNYKLSDNFNSERAVFMYPDSIVRNVAGTNVALHGFYMAAAAAGWLSSKQNVAIPLTFKTLSGFTLTRDKVFRQTILNSLGAEGATVVQPVTGGGQVLAGRTTSQSGFVEDEEISIIFIRDTVKRTLRNSLKGFIGGVQSNDTVNLVSARVNSIMAGLVGQGLVTQYGNIRVEQDKVDPRQLNVFLRFTPAYPINYVFIDIEVGVI